MLSKTQISEIRTHLEKSQNPIFFFDNDPDGLCSFLLLRRWLGRGKGVAIKSFPELDVSYFKKVEELNADYVFILDKPMVSNAFWSEIEKNNIPVVWIDHHELNGEVPEFVNYYNSFVKDSKDGSVAEPVTYSCYQATRKEEDLWLAVVGCISDRFVPDFYSDFEKKYPDISLSSKNAFSIFYSSLIGKVARILSFALKDRTTNVVSMIKFLVSVKSPYEVLEENYQNYTMHKRFEFINSKYSKFVKKAEEVGKNSKKILFFQYGGDLSISSDLSNELSYKFPDKVIVVAYINGTKATISIRGSDVKEPVLKALANIEQSSGGGHKDAVGAKVNVEDLDRFREALSKSIS